MMSSSKFFALAVAVALVAALSARGSAADLLQRAHDSDRAGYEYAASISGNVTAPDIHLKCDACKVALEVAANSIFNTYACKKGIETAVKLVCHFTGEFSKACSILVTGICDICHHVDHCSWHSVVDRACKREHFC